MSVQPYEYEYEIEREARQARALSSDPQTCPLCTGPRSQLLEGLFYKKNNMNFKLIFCQSEIYMNFIFYLAEEAV